MIYLTIAFLVVIAFIYIRNRNKETRLRNQYNHDIIKVKEERDNMSKRLVKEDIYHALSQMDKTNTYYNEEDEANRELTTCMSLLGHQAVYHYRLDNDRFADILVDHNILVEGKLDPQPADIDRLIGQLTDYTPFPYHIVVVIYGLLTEPLLGRLQIQVLSKFPNLSLVYLNNPNRVRRA